MLHRAKSQVMTIDDENSPYKSVRSWDDHIRPVRACRLHLTLHLMVAMMMVMMVMVMNDVQFKLAA